MLGLPAHVTACLFDLDGVLTQTAKVHNAAWTETFNAFLRDARGGHRRAVPPVRPGTGLQPVRGRQTARRRGAYLPGLPGITLPEGTPDDPPEARHGQRPGQPQERHPAAADPHRRRRGLRRLGAPTWRRRPPPGCAGPSSPPAPTAATWSPPPGWTRCWRPGSTGWSPAERGLRGKPHPDTFLAGAGLLGVAPANAAVFEDALAGVAAGRAGGFGYVVGVDRVGQADELRAHGADVVVTDLAELLKEPVPR